MKTILKPSKDLVFDLINAANPQLPYPLTVDNVVLEKITTVTPNAANNFRNTSVRVRGQQTDGFTDQVTLYYDRLQIGLFFPYYTSGTAAAVVSFTAATIHQLLPLINEKYGTNFAEIDISNSTLGGVSSPNYENGVTIAAASTSPAFVGQTSLRYNRGRPVLDTSITQPVVAALNHPITVADKRCIDMLTYGLDFTSYKNYLTITSAGLPQWAGLRQVLNDLGVPDYPAPANGNTVSDVTTASLASANKAFDRVVVHSGIDANGITGVAYYHYNV